MVFGPDTVFTGISGGWPLIQVKVFIQNHRMLSIEIVKDNSTPEFAQKTVSVLVDKMIQQQSIDVVAVSGATLSSRALIKAVQNALKQ